MGLICIFGMFDLICIIYANEVIVQDCTWQSGLYMTILGIVHQDCTWQSDNQDCTWQSWGLYMTIRIVHDNQDCTWQSWGLYMTIRIVHDNPGDCTWQSGLNMGLYCTWQSGLYMTIRIVHDNPGDCTWDCIPGDCTWQSGLYIVHDNLEIVHDQDCTGLYMTIPSPGLYIITPWGLYMTIRIVHDNPQDCPGLYMAITRIVHDNPQDCPGLYMTLVLKPLKKSPPPISTDFAQLNLFWRNT